MDLRNPDLGNTYVENAYGVVSRSIDGEIDVFRNPDWPVEHKFTINFSALSKAQADQMMSWYKSSAGQVVQITDHERNIWEGYITNETALIRQTRPDCGFEATIDFEGNIIGVEPP